MVVAVVKHGRRLCFARGVSKIVAVFSALSPCQKRSSCSAVRKYGRCVSLWKNDRHVSVCICGVRVCLSVPLSVFVGVPGTLLPEGGSKPSSKHPVHPSEAHPVLVGMDMVNSDDYAEMKRSVRVGTKLRARVQSTKSKM